ncbi:hypothetical protein ANCDUO_03601 [Ancylostoma duodenale]|uniref:Peptidase S1 domain-containing protein n=1 Tax=Ancylostoma duodenale TaxID=51022 RepID=A0A0C2D8M0_9BILA|nr:hypothetical protein ANCDUO_03601 [Ancylostoma duodenale]
MPKAHESISTPLTAAGYGTNNSRTKYSPGLQEVVYYQYEEDPRTITTYSSTQTICEGDSGGPLFQTDQQGKYVLMGIANSVRGKHTHCAPDRFNTFTDIRKHLEWICEKTGEEHSHRKQCLQM